MATTSSTEQRTDKPGTDRDDNTRPLSQLNQRLLQLAAQLDQIHAEVDKLSARIDDDSAQISALVGNLTDTQSTQLLQRRLAEFTEQMSAEHEQLNFLGLKLTELATQDQLVRMASTVATQGQVSELLDIVHNLVRTQDLANRLSETREEHVESLLGTLQEIVVHRQQAIERNDQRDQEQVDAIRRAAAASSPLTFCLHWTAWRSRWNGRAPFWHARGRTSSRSPICRLPQGQMRASTRPRACSTNCVPELRPRKKPVPCLPPVRPWRLNPWPRH